MFSDIKDQLDNPAVLQIMAYSEYEESLERAARRAQTYRENKYQQFYGWVENGSIFGVCGFTVHPDMVEITNISVVEQERKHGYGSAMIAAIRIKHGMAITAETDDDAVGFYRKCGFETTAFQKHGVRRWNCVLPALKSLNQQTDK